MNNESYYTNNKAYSALLDSRSKEDFKKYTDTINRFVPEKGRFLDVGCGTGIAMSLIKEGVDICGVEVSDTSVQVCKQKGLSSILYNGKEIPYQNDFFDVVASYNVLEHVDNPVGFLDEQLRVLKNDGFLFVVCPNFLSVTNNYHYHTRGMYQKIKNMFEIIKRIMFRTVSFEKMETTISEDLLSDNDACNVTNPLDILKWSKANKLKLCYWSASSLYSKGLVSRLDYPVLRLFLGSSFFVFQKNGNKK